MPEWETAREVFEVANPLSEKEFFNLFWKNDKTIIATKSENKTGGTPPKYVRIDRELCLFLCNSVVGFKHGRREADYLRKLHEKYQTGQVRAFEENT